MVKGLKRQFLNRLTLGFCLATSLIHGCASSQDHSKKEGPKQNSRTSSETDRLRSDAFEKLGRHQEQIDVLTEAIKIFPMDAELYEKRSKAFYLIGKLESAVEDCESAIKLGHYGPDVFRTLASAYEELGQFEKAIVFRTKVLGFNTNDAFAWSARAKVYEQLGKHKLA